MTTLIVNSGDFGSLARDGEKFYFRCRSFVDIKTGQPLPERREQKIAIATCDTSQYKSVEKSPAPHIKAKERRERIVAWEAATTPDALVLSPVFSLCVLRCSDRWPESDLFMRPFSL